MFDLSFSVKTPDSVSEQDWDFWGRLSVPSLTLRRQLQWWKAYILFVCNKTGHWLARLMIFGVYIHNVYAKQKIAKCMQCH